MTLFKRKLGNFGEAVACKYLTKNGYTIIAKNQRFSKYSEIDIIAKINNTLVFVEVKTRKNNDYGNPLEAITKTKYEHLKQGVLRYWSENSKFYDDYRLDAIATTLEPKVEINHMQNITF